MFFALLLSFLAGGVVFVLASVYLFATIERVEGTKKRAIEVENSQAPPESSTSIYGGQDVRGGWLRLRTSKDEEQKKKVDLRPTFFVLKANILFEYNNEQLSAEERAQKEREESQNPRLNPARSSKDKSRQSPAREQENTPSAVVSLDGCTVTLIRPKLERPRWHRKNPIQLQHPLKPLFKGSQTCFLYAPTSYELEGWYHSLQNGIFMLQRVDKSQKEKEYFSYLKTSIPHPSPHFFGADWVNAIMGRVFWNVYNQSPFIAFLTEKVNEKLAKKASKIKFVDSIKVKELYVGPNFPAISEVQLVDISPRGAVRLDLDLLYKGRAHLVIEINAKVPGITSALPLPFSLTLRLISMSGRVRLFLGEPPSDRFWVGFHHEPVCTIETETEIPKFYILKNLPAMTSVITEKMKAEILKMMVLPRMEDFPLPFDPLLDPVDPATGASTPSSSGSLSTLAASSAPSVATNIQPSATTYKVAPTGPLPPVPVRPSSSSSTPSTSSSSTSASSGSMKTSGPLPTTAASTSALLSTTSSSSTASGAFKRSTSLNKESQFGERASTSVLSTSASAAVKPPSYHQPIHQHQSLPPNFFASTNSPPPVYHNPPPSYIPPTSSSGRTTPPPMYKEPDVTVAFRAADGSPMTSSGQLPIDEAPPAYLPPVPSRQRAGSSGERKLVILPSTFSYPAPNPKR